MSSRGVLLSLLLPVWAISGCTAGSHHRGVKAEPYPIGVPADSRSFQDARAANAKNERAVNGIRYYQKSPYLLVYSDSKGGVQWEVRFMPDPTKKVAVDFQVLTSTLNATVEFDNGTLKSSTESGDATAVPVAVLEAIKTVIPELVKAVGILEAPPAGAAATVKFPAPRLYKILVNGNTVTFRGGAGDVDVQLTGSSKP